MYPGFHFGLRPHYTLGYEKVSCLKALMLASPKKSNIQTVKLVHKKPCIGQILRTLRRKIIVLTSIDREKPCKGDTRSTPKPNTIISIPNFNADTFQYTNISDPTNTQRPQPNPTMNLPSASQHKRKPIEDYTLHGYG